MPTELTLADLPDKLYETIRRRAAGAGRTIQMEVRLALEQTYAPPAAISQMTPAARFAEAQRLRLRHVRLSRPPRPLLLVLRNWRDERDGAVADKTGLR
jgi:plasmid stability protein